MCINIPGEYIDLEELRQKVESKIENYKQCIEAIIKFENEVPDDED